MIGTQHTAATIARAIASWACPRQVWEVILHHTDGPKRASYKGLATVQGIHRFHTSPEPKGRGWSDIGYHYLVGPDGLIFLGRPLERVGAHTKVANVGTVGVAMILAGNVEDPTEAQVAATKATIAALCTRFGFTPEHNFRSRHGFHRDHMPTDCPGTRVSKAMVLGWFRATPDPVEANDDKVLQPAAWAEEAVAWCEAERIMVGDDRGFRPLDTVTRQEMAVIAQRIVEAARKERT